MAFWVLGGGSQPHAQYTGYRDSVPVTNLAYLVLYEARDDSGQHEIPSHYHDAGLSSTPQREQTESGYAIKFAPASSLISPDDPDAANYLTDKAAADLVRKSIKKHKRDSLNSRILKSLITSSTFEMDDAALQNLFHAANDIFFSTDLAGRVAWDWSDPTSPQYQDDIVGTTALKRCARGGWETLIVLSTPVLRNPRYDRRLLICTFLHEMIHCYLYVKCGPAAGHNNGHTEGFSTIAGLIDDWVGGELLRLRCLSVDIEYFRVPDGQQTFGSWGEGEHRNTARWHPWERNQRM